MGSFANTLFTILLGWLRGAVSAVWSAFTSEDGNGFLTWIGDHWILLAVILCMIGLAADLCVYLLRWEPFKVWRSFLSRGRNRDADEGEPEEKNVRKKKEPERPQRVFVPAAPATEIRNEEPDLSQWKQENEHAAPAQGDDAGMPPTVTGAGYVVPADSPYRRPAVQDETGYRQTRVQEKRQRRTENTGHRETVTEGNSAREPAERDERVYRRPAETEGRVYRKREETEEKDYRRTPEKPVIRTPVSREYIAQEDYPDNREAQESPAPVVFRRRRRISVSDLFSDPEEELKQIDAPQDIIDRNRAYREPVYPRGWKRNEDQEG